MIIIFSHEVSGHYLEYLHHIYEICAQNSAERYLFLVPETFQKVKGYLKWEHSPNIGFEYISEKELLDAKRLGKVKCAFSLSKIIRNSIIRSNATKVFSTSLISLIPFAPFVLPHKVRLSGIIYNIFLHSWSECSIKVKFEHIVKYLLLSYSRVIEKVYILNDDNCAGRLNGLFHVSKYKYLADPYTPIDVSDGIDVRKKYDIDPGMKIFAHFGSLRDGKGTLEILRSLCNLPDTIKERSAFIIAGVVNNEIKSEFDAILKKIPGDVNLILENSYCSYEFLASMCQVSSCLLVPYKDVSRSSGVIGYASQFSVPVIATNKGLLGQLVKQYGLGLLIDEVSAECLVDAYSKVINGEVMKPSRRYCDSHRVADFQNGIKESLSYRMS